VFSAIFHYKTLSFAFFANSAFGPSILKPEFSNFTDFPFASVLNRNDSKGIRHNFDLTD
jgi:hypothetical protein